MKNSDEQHPTILIVEDIDWIRAGMKKRSSRGLPRSGSDE
jgi:hypothetical protein